MNNLIVRQLTDIVRNSHWPMAQRTNMQTRRIYERGLDEVNTYSGDPIAYGNALSIFKQSDSCPYAYAGIAYTLAHASWFDDKADTVGLKEAMDWLEKAQEWESDRIEINFIEAFIYIIGEELDNGRAILDHLGKQNPQYFHYCVMEMLYSYYSKNMALYKSWFEKALNFSQPPLQRAYVLSLAGDYYLELGRYEQSIKLLKEVVKLKPNDARAWHNMSLMLLKMENYADASLCNQKALSIIDFEAARSVEQQLQKVKGGRMGRLFKR